MNAPRLPLDPFHVRLHGRGGQGVVTAAELLGLAAFFDGFEVQAFPSFGSERMGAPVTSFCRISTRPIRVREPVTHPHALVILDATLLHHVDVFGGLEHGGYVLINSVRSVADLGVESIVEKVGAAHFGVVAATDLAREHTGAARPNVAALGSLAALTGAVSLGSIERALQSRFGAAAQEGNVRLARAGFDAIKAVARA